MTVSVWRVAVESPLVSADNPSGTGAKISGGRWNSKGTSVVYCSTNIALATLETVHCLRNGSLPLNRFLVRVDIPDTVWATRHVLNPLPGGWNAVPAGLRSRASGDQWVASSASALLLVPSVIVPQEFNVLINPQHTDAAAINATTLERWIYDSRFLL